ncbi:MAG: dockerin type I repeat-containing protein, partial [Clostridia bacterium]|nr:dockerin type I repeat-containing protein [Clostridia bacterium]
LYSEESLVAAGVECDGTAAKTLALDRNVKYVTFLISGIELYCARIAEFEAWTAEKESGSEPGEPGFTPVNVLASNVSAARCVQFYPSTYYVGDATHISDEAIAKLTDSDKTTTYDCQTALDWDPPRYLGVEYTLDDTYYIGELKIYSGYTTSIDTFDVYASDSFETLYSEESLVAAGVECDGTAAKTLALDRNVKYVTFLISGIELYCARIAEFEAWTAEEESGSEPGFTPENSLPGSLVKSVAMYEDGYVSYEEFINAETLAKFTDGDTANHNDFNGTLEWDPPRMGGAEFTLGEAVNIGEIKLYASIGTDYPETYRVYASDSLETLYTDDSLLVSGAQTTGNVITVDVNKEIQYIAFFCESYTGNPRFKEIEAYTACDHAQTEVRDAVDATCTEAGYTGDTYCLICGAKIVEGETIGALGHSFTNYVSNNDATCTADGTKTAKCDNCDETDTITDEGTMLAHTVGEWLSDETNHWHVCSACQNKVDEAAHSYEWVVTKEATEQENGLKEEICSVCGYKSGNSEDIIYSSHTAGDINGDGAVNNKDLTRLFQYLSDWDVEVDESALDVNGDGSVNNKDLTRLFQYLSDWDVQIF